jgi:hypothetical protein
LIAHPNKSPIRKHPIRLAKKVDHGNSFLEIDIIFEIANLKRLPSPPPIKT